MWDNLSRGKFNAMISYEMGFSMRGALTMAFNSERYFFHPTYTYLHQKLPIACIGLNVILI